MEKIQMILFILTILASLASAQEKPSLQAPMQVLLADGSPLEVGAVAHAAPIYTDFDGDAVPDLIVGEFEGGLCHIYKNYGTAANPIFRDSMPFMADGRIASVPPD